MPKWTKLEHGYAGAVETPMPAAMAAALEGNENFQKGEAFQRGQAEGAPQAAPRALSFQVTIGAGLLRAYERRHHADLRGVALDERLDKVAGLMVANDPEYVELVEASLREPAPPAQVRSDDPPAAPAEPVATMG